MEDHIKSSVQPQEIKAAVIRQKGGPFELETLQLDGPRASEVLVRIVATGVCATDIHTREEHLPMPLPTVLGHKGVGVVALVGAVVTAVPEGPSRLLRARCPA
jgi:aryl-alcohol dehydrogenase